MMALQLNPLQKRRLGYLRVQALYLFGSRAQGRSSPLSDYDYAVLLAEKGHSRLGPLYLKLYEFLSEISPRSLKNDVLDIVFPRDIGLELCFHVVRYGALIYDGDAKARQDFEERITLLYCDYRPVLDLFDRAILDSL